MRAAAFALVAVTTSAVHLAACGGSNPPSQTPAAAPVPVAASDAGVARVAGDAGPTSTTTQALDTRGNVAGTRLTPRSSVDAGTDVAAPHQPEPGRSVPDIKALLAAHRDEARACYDHALSTYPGEGNLDVRWTIDPAGNVVNAEVDTSRSDILEPTVGSCIVAIVKKIHFAASAKGFETKAHYPFNFHPRGRQTQGGDAGR